MAKSFIKTVSPSRARAKTIEWPLPFEGAETPKVRMSILGADKMESANLDATDHFAKIKRKISKDDVVFELRERAALVMLAFETADGLPIADSVDELVEEMGYESIGVLYREWSHWQAEVTSRPMTSAQMDALIEELKKNTREDLLRALPSSSLIELVRTLASQLALSTPANGSG